MITTFFKKCIAGSMACLLAWPPGPAWSAAGAPSENSAEGAAKVPAKAAPVALEKVEVGSDLIRVRLSGVVKYNSYIMDNPARLILELPDTEHQPGVKAAEGKGKFLLRVRSGQFERSPRMISRIVLELRSPVNYRISRDKNDLVVQLVGAATLPGLSAEAPKAQTPAPEKPAPAKPQKIVITPKPSPAAPVVAKKPAAAPAAPSLSPGAPTPAQSPSQPAASEESTPGAPGESAKPKARPKPVSPAAAPAAARSAPQPVEAALSPGLSSGAPPPISSEQPTETSSELGEMASRIPTPKRAETIVAASSGLSPGAPPPSPAAPASSEGPAKAADARSLAPARGDIMGRLPHDTVSLDFENTDIRDVMKLLAAKAKVNIIHGPDVGGTLTLHLADVPFDEAFRTVLTMSRLTTDQVGDNILRVITPGALSAERATEIGVTKVIPLHYSQAAAIMPAVTQVRTAEGRKGITIADPKTNSLIVTEPLEGIARTETLIRQLDVKPKQVIIEAKLVEVNYGRNLHYGIQWNYLEVDSGKALGKQGRSAVGSTVQLPSTFSTPLNENTLTITQPSGGVGTLGGATGVNLPATAVFGAMTLGRVTNNYLLNASLTAAAAQGKVKVLSDPKIATLNNQPANINVTTQIPYTTTSVTNNTTQTNVSYTIVGIVLTVTPTINADGRITLDINPSVSQPSATQAVGTNAPAVDTRSAKTTVIVKDGETIVIGGLISDSISTQIAKIPILGDIPILGWLFKKKSVVRNRGELLIFVTPKILPD